MEGNSMRDNQEMDLPPGFRFHPTDEELITRYLSPKVLDNNFCAIAIGEVDLNKVEPWDLPWMAKMGEKEWYFFCVRDRKYPTGMRTNRATDAGYWKATGKDKEIFQAKSLVGMKKTLVFYRGRAPKGEKTNWVMHEYRSEPPKTSSQDTSSSSSVVKNEWVICRIFKKSSGGKKVHISGLVRTCNNLGTSKLPPLMDMSSGTTTSHVTCFSEDDQKPQHVTIFPPPHIPMTPVTASVSKNICSQSLPANSMIFPRFSGPNSAVFTPSYMENVDYFQNQFPEIMEEQSILRLILSEENRGFLKNGNNRGEFSQEMEMEMSSCVSEQQQQRKQEEEEEEKWKGSHSYEDQEEYFRMIPAGDMDYCRLWNY